MSRRGTAEEKTAKSDPIFRNRLVNMLVNRILKHGKKSLAYQIIYRAMKKIQQKTETNPLSVLRQAIRGVTPDIAVKARRVGGSTHQVPIEIGSTQGKALAIRWFGPIHGDFVNIPLEKEKIRNNWIFLEIGCKKEVRNPLFDSDSPTPVVAFLSVTSKVAASASATRIFDIPFYFSSNEWHLLLEILAIFSMILGNLIAITQTSMKRMLAYSSIGQIGYVIIGIIVGDSNGGYASMITYMLFYISMNLGTFACIVSFGLRTGTDNIRDYAGLYTKDPFLALSLALCLLSLGGLPPLAGFFGKLHLFWCGWQAGLYFLVSIGLLTSVVSIYYYLKIIKLLMTGRNQEITPHVRNYRRSPLRSNNSIELSMIVCVIASTIPGISMNPIIEIAQDTLF
ncbi:hypothetical protein Lal_00045184 [Lupinus albus]|nr:hypothetical protein Lal_00045184 [Lupinus albus]